MTRIALAPCSPFPVSASLMTRTAELTERIAVRMHTHLCEMQDEDAVSAGRSGRRPVDHLAEVGWLTDRTGPAHVVWPSARRSPGRAPRGWGRRAARRRS